MKESSKRCFFTELEKTYDVIIVGAGIAGLSAAYTLDNAKLDTLTLESNEYAGGRIRTIYYDNVYAEAGALVVTEEEPETINLLQKLKCDSFIELGIHGAEIFFGKKFVKLSRVDVGIGSLKDIASLFNLLSASLADRGRTLPLPGPRLYLAYRRMLRKMAELSQHIEFPYKPYLHGETDKISFGEFLDQFHPDLKAYIDLQLKVTAGASSDEISLYWGLITFNWNIDGKFYFLRGGTSVLPKALTSFLGQRLQLGTKVKSIIERQNTVEVEFTCSCGKNHRAKAKKVIMATPPQIVLNVIKEIEPNKKEALEAVRFGAYIPVHLYCRSRFWEKRVSTGYLNAAGVVFADLVDGTREQDSQTGVLIAFIGGQEATRFINAPDNEIIDEVKKDLNLIFPNFESEIIETRVFRWKNAIPYLDPKTGHRLEELRRPQGNIHFCGDYTQGAGINDAVFSGQFAAKQILEGK